jgi:hypothetical protein
MLAALLISSLLVAASSARADDTGGTAGGGTALALATLVGAHSPTLDTADKSALARMLDGNASVRYPADRKITVKADSVVCRSSNPDITAHSCDLTFGTRKASLAGRAAHELYATIVEAGVEADGAAGTIYEALRTLSCTIDPNAVKQRDGSGADCTFVPGQ